MRLKTTYLATLIIGPLLVCPAQAQRTMPIANLEPTLFHLWEKHQVSEAVSLSHEILKLKPNDANKKARVLAHKILGYYAHGKDEKESLSQLDKAIRLNSTDMDLFYTRGVIKFENHQLPESVLDFKKSIALDPTKGYPYRMLANAYAVLGNDQKAIENYTLALARLAKSDQFYPVCFYFRGQIYEKLHQNDKAIADYTQLTVIHQDSDDGYLHRAACYVREKQYDKALKDYDTLIKRDKYNDDVFRARGNVLMLKGDKTEALAAYAQAIKLEPSASNYRARASAYEKIGRHDLAEQDNQKAQAR